MNKGESNGETLPIDAIRSELLERLADEPLVIAAPTGSGKSTQVPRWCPGRVLVVEPRRVACRTLAQRVAELEGVDLGAEVGYRVRDDNRASDRTRVLFATPGVVLRSLDRLDDHDTVILDEVHERGIETDLLLALCRKRRAKGLVVMSATLEAERVAEALVGTVLRAEGRSHPIEVRYRPGEALLPEGSGLEARVADALAASADWPGDTLVFLPGKGEIARVAEALAGRRGLTVCALHGGLPLEEQRRAFEPAPGTRKVVLSTNVAETSVTVPSVSVVIDSGLVRRTRYHHGRGYLTLAPIARDSADQRAGRAGRTQAGLCIRLWSEAASLQPHTPPEIARESLVPLVLAVGCAGESLDALPWLDPPTAHALEDARSELRALDAIDADGQITARGRALFGLPLDPALGRLLVEAAERGNLDDAIDLVAALSVGRPLLLDPRPELPDDDLRAHGCDATALVRAVREGEPRRHRLAPGALAEARTARKRLRTAYGLPGKGPREGAPDRRALVMTALAADPRSAHVRRRRKRELAWNNGGSELRLSRESAIDLTRPPDAVAVLDVRALAERHGRRTLIATCAMPVSRDELQRAGLGRDRIAGVQMRGKAVLARVERVHAGVVLETREELPRGEAAREAIARALLEGRVMRDAVEASRRAVAALQLARGLSARGLLREVGEEELPPAPESIDSFLTARLESLGVERGDDLALLSEADLLPPTLPYAVAQLLEQRFPLVVELGDATYAVDYDLSRRRATLHLTRGQRAKPPPREYLPALGGFSVFVEAGGKMHRAGH